MATDLIASDIELAVFRWAKANTNISTAVNGQVHFEVPGTTPPFPLITIEVAGGFGSVTEALIEESIFTISCWARPYDKATSARVASVVRTEAFNLYRSPVTVTAGAASVTLHGAEVSGVLWVPDPEAGYARHVVSATFTTTSTAVA